MITREKRDLVLTILNEPIDPNQLNHCFDCKKATVLIRKSTVKVETGSGDTKKTETKETLNPDIHCEHFNVLMDDIVYHCEQFEPLPESE